MLALYLAACHSPEAASTVSKYSWRWTQKASETCRAILQIQINILPSCITLVLYIYIFYSKRLQHLLSMHAHPLIFRAGGDFVTYESCFWLLWYWVWNYSLFSFICYQVVLNTFAASYLNTQGLMLKIASVDLSRSNFSIAFTPLFQLKSAT